MEKYIFKGGTVERPAFVRRGPEGEQVIPIAWDEGDQEFNRFKNEVNQNIPNLTKEWWDRIEVHLHGGIYQGQDEYGMVDDEEEDDDDDDDISKIVTLTAIIGYAYLSADWEEGSKLVYYIDDIHNEFLPSSFRMPLEDGLFSRRKFINFINILLKHAEQTQLYRSALDIEMEGTALKRQSSNYKERWDRVKDSQGNVKWVPKEGVAESRAVMQIPGFNIKLFEDPLSKLTDIAGLQASRYGNIVDSVQKLSTRKLFVNLVILLKAFVTKAYQLDAEDLDYQDLDYRVALKVVESEINEEYHAKYTQEMSKPGVILLKPNGLHQVVQVFSTVFDPLDESDSDLAVRVESEDVFDDWVERVSTSIDAASSAVTDSLLEWVKEYELPNNYSAFYTPILITHLILYEKQESLKIKINKKIEEYLTDFRSISKEVISEEYKDIVELISKLWAIMYAWHILYRRIYIEYIKPQSMWRFEKDHVRFDQKMTSTELGFWTYYLKSRFETTEYKDDIDLSPDPTTFKKVFARVEFLKKKLEPSFSNPPLIVMPHLHDDLEHFRSNDEMIYRNEKYLINQLKGHFDATERRLNLVIEGRESTSEYNEEGRKLGSHNEQIAWMRESLIDMVNFPDIYNLLYYYEELIDEQEIGPDKLPFIREFKQKYGDDVTVLYDFEHVEYRMLQNVNSIYNEDLKGFTEKKMKEILKKEGHIDRILFVNDTIKDSKDEIVPETKFAHLWPERKRYLDNVLKEEDDKDEPDISDLMKIPLGDDPLQRKWISGVRDLINPIDELKEKFIQERRSKYGTTTKQGMVANQAAQRAKREKDFKESTRRIRQQKDSNRFLEREKRARASKALTRHKDKPLRRTPIREKSRLPKGNGFLGNKRSWKRTGFGKDKYKDYFMTSQFRSAARDRWGDNYLDDGVSPQVFLDAVDFEDEPFIPGGRTAEKRLDIYKRAFQTIDKDIPLVDDEVLPAFIEEVLDLEERGKNGEIIRMVVLDQNGNPMLDRDDPNGKAYLGSSKIKLKDDYGELHFDSIEDIANYKLPFKIGQTKGTEHSPSEDVYQILPFLKIHRKPIKIKEVFTRNNEESKPIIQQPVLPSNPVWNDERSTIASIIEHLRPQGTRSNINMEIPEESIGPVGLPHDSVPRMGGGRRKKRKNKLTKKKKKKRN